MSLRFIICHLELTRIVIKEVVPPPPGDGNRVAPRAALRVRIKALHFRLHS